MIHRLPFERHDGGRIVLKVLLVAPKVMAILKAVITNLLQSPKGNSPLPVGNGRALVHDSRTCLSQKADPKF